MAGTNLSFSKVVATPTPNAWSQAYSAGSLFAAISLHSDAIPQANDNLNKVGKDLISTLESEFFPLENKDLESIKQAITNTISKVDEGIKLSFVVCYMHENILYLYAMGGGKAVLKREEKIGTVIDSDEGNEVKSASGYVQDKDFIVLQTQPFIRIVASSILASALDRNTPDEAAEDLAPHVHEKTEGGASAVILNYKEATSGVGPIAEAGVSVGVALNQIPEDSEEEKIDDTVESIDEKLDDNLEITEETLNKPTEINDPIEKVNDIVPPPPTQMNQNIEEVSSPPLPNKTNEEQTSPYLPDQKSRRKMPKMGLGKIKGLTRRKKLMLIAGIILIAVIIIVGFFVLTNGTSSSNEAKFNEVYNEAKAKFDEGQSLKELNTSLAEEKFKEAQAILIQNKDTFPDGSNEDNQIEALLVQVNNALGGGGSETSSSTASEVDKSDSQLLSVQIDNPDSTYFTQNDDFIYFINSKGVARLDKGNSEEDAIIDESWKEAGGIGVFGSNVYVLDKTNNILKFVPSGSEFSETNYTTDADLADSVAMGIDGSIYVLKNDGSIQKFTRGTTDDFSVSGLEKPLSSPSRIVTGEDLDNIYILDKGNSRIVVLDKEGAFVKAYSADILKNARDIDPQEADGAIYVLSGDKVYKLGIE